MTNLYPHNQTACEAVMASYRKGERKACIIHATGTGKSYVIAAVAQHFSRVLIVAPNNIIIGEIQKAYNGKADYITYQSLINSIPETKYDLIVTDEFHRCGAEIWGQCVSQLINANKDAFVFGTTATNIRGTDHGRDMADELFSSNVVSHISLSDAIEQGILPKPKAYVCGLYKFDLSSLECKQLTERQRKNLNRVKLEWEKSSGVSNIIRNYFDQGYHKRVIVFCTNKDEANSLVTEIPQWFQDAGITKTLNIYSILSCKGELRNTKALNDFQNVQEGCINVMVSVNMLNEGYHVGQVDCIICMRKTVSNIVVMQQLGRCLSVGSRPPLVLDLVSNIKSYTIRTGNRKDGSGNHNVNHRQETVHPPFDIIGVDTDVVSELQDIVKSKYSEEELIEALESFRGRTIKEFVKAYPHLYDYHNRRCRHVNLYDYLVSARRTALTYEECLKEAKKYSSRMEFKRGSRNHYNRLYQLGLLDKACQHMPTNKLHYTYGECIEIVKKYSNVSEFKKHDLKLFGYVHRKGWLKDIEKDCNFVKKIGNTTETEIEKFAASGKGISDMPMRLYSYAKRHGLLDKYYPNRKRRKPNTAS